MNQKLKNENYVQLGGINSKASQYITGSMEFLDLTNLDFQQIGSLSQRWGSTMYVGQTVPGPITSLFEFSRLDGSSYVLFSHSGGIWSGATTGQSQGLSLTLQSATLSSFAYVNALIASGVSIIAPLAPVPVIPFDGNREIYAGSSLFFENPSIQSDNRLSFSVLNNQLFAADGNKFFRYDGITTYPVGLPPVLRATTATNGVSGFYSNLNAGDLIGLGMTGYYNFYFSYVNNRGFEGPLWPQLFITGQSFITGSTAATSGGTYIVAKVPFATPLSLGISAINQYLYWAASLATGWFLEVDFWNGYGGQMALVSTTPASGSTFTYVSLGSTIGGQSFLNTNAGKLAPTNGYRPLGLTIIPASPGAHPNYNVNSEVRILDYFPRYLETYQNRLFSAGFSLSPSTVWFSDISEPEGYAPNFNFEVRTNDGDVVTCLKSYSTRLYIGKLRSFHILTGDNPDNFFLQEITDQAGIANNRCAVVYDDIFIFLDIEKGVMKWNGASLERISEKIQPLFDSMNRSAALTQACMVHDKIRNQILVAIPINGSTTNNITAVYDYAAGAWTTHKGYSPSAFAAIRGRNNTKNAFYGDYQGRVNWFGASFLADNGAGFTCYLKTRFLHDMGESTQKMFRRLFLNTDSPASSTLVFGVNFFQDYGSSVVLGTTMILSQFQNRIDYGVSAKSLAFELSNLQTSLPLKIHGFTIESRFLRRV